MTVTVMRDAITCPRCGTQRVVTHRHRRRAEARGGGILCTNCRGIGDARPFSEGDLRYWLRRFGADCPRDTPAAQFIAAGGAPAELVELAKSVYPT